MAESSGRRQFACLLLLLQAAVAAAAGEPLDVQPAGAAAVGGDTARLLALLGPDPAEDPFAADEGPGAYPGLLAHAAAARAQPAPPRQQPQAPHGGRVHQHHARANATHRFSRALQMMLPQPWDAINMSRIVRDNLEPDLAIWQQQPLAPRVRHLFEAANSSAFTIVPNTRRLVQIRDGVLSFPLMPPGPKRSGCDEDCDPQLDAFVTAMRQAVTHYRLPLPDVLFLLNTDDSPICNNEAVLKRECVAPVISLSKPLVSHADLLAPVMKADDARLVHRSAPWAAKAAKAFFRGVPSCGEMPFPPGCARSWVARLAQDHPDLLDAGLVEPYGTPEQVRGDPVLRDGRGPLPVLPCAPMSRLPYYKWLLNLDGHVAAYRLAQLLATNSLVLKQESTMAEFYYRSLRAWHHYVPIFKASEHDLLPRLAWAARHEGVARRITGAANRFARRYASYAARCVYWVYVLHAYRGLVADMDEHFAATGGGSSSSSAGGAGSSSSSSSSGGGGGERQQVTAVMEALLKQLAAIQQQGMQQGTQQQQQQQQPLAQQWLAPQQQQQAQELPQQRQQQAQQQAQLADLAGEAADDAAGGDDGDDLLSLLAGST